MMDDQKDSGPCSQTVSHLVLCIGRTLLRTRCNRQCCSFDTRPSLPSQTEGSNSLPKPLSYCELLCLLNSCSCAQQNRTGSILQLPQAKKLSFQRPYMCIPHISLCAFPITSSPHCEASWMAFLSSKAEHMLWTLQKPFCCSSPREWTKPGLLVFLTPCCHWRKIFVFVALRIIPLEDVLMVAPKRTFWGGASKTPAAPQLPLCFTTLLVRPTKGQAQWANPGWWRLHPCGGGWTFAELVLTGSEYPDTKLLPPTSHGITA